MKISKRQIAMIHVAKKKLGLTDDQYRSVLVQLAGVTSSKDLDPGGLDAVMGYFEWRGFTPLKGHGQSFGNREGMASFAQLELIRDLWREYTHGAYDGEDELNKWLLNKWKVSSLRFLTKAAAQKAITALKAMKRRQA